MSRTLEITAPSAAGKSAGLLPDLQVGRLQAIDVELNLLNTRLNQLNIPSDLTSEVISLQNQVNTLQNVLQTLTTNLEAEQQNFLKLAIMANLTTFFFNFQAVPGLGLPQTAGPTFDLANPPGNWASLGSVLAPVAPIYESVFGTTVITWPPAGGGIPIADPSQAPTP
jgi:hypothetical protein